MGDDLADGFQLTHGVRLRVEHDVVDLREEGKKINDGIQMGWFLVPISR